MECLTTRERIPDDADLVFNDPEEMPQAWLDVCESPLLNQAMVVGPPPPQPALMWELPDSVIHAD